MLGMTPFASSKRRIGPVDVASIGQDEALAHLTLAAAQQGHLKIAFANAHFINEAARDAEFREGLPQFLILPDGIGVDVASKLLYGEKFPANLNGTDFIPQLLASHPGSWRIALMGAKPAVAEKAAVALRQLAPQHSVSVLSHGYFSPAEEPVLLEQLAANPVDVLLVAMGNPAQEKWIARTITKDHTRLAFGVGALFDFLAGEVPRAPEIVRQLRLEWVWRLAQEPARLWRRYVLGNPVFLLRVLRQKYFEPRQNRAN